MHPIRPLRPEKRRQLLYQTAQDDIKSYIVQNGLKPGAPLPPESELAQQLRISRNSVREAVKSLEALGILEVRPGAGLFVRSFSFDPILDNLAYGIQFDVKKLSDLLEVRHYIEVGAVARVVESTTPAQLEQLAAVLTKMRTAAEEGKYSPDLDESFHRLLYENIDNTALLKILSIFWDIYREAQDRVSMPEPANPMDTYQRHVLIVAALEARDVTAMQAAIEHHRTGVDARMRMLEAAQTGPQDMS